MIADANLQVWLDAQPHAGQTVLVPYVKSVTELQLNYRVDVIQSGAAGTSRVSQQGRVTAAAAQPTPLGRVALGRQKGATCSVELTLGETDRQLGSYRFDCPQ